MDRRKDIWRSRYYAIPRRYMSLAGIWPYHAIRSRYLLFVPMFIFSLSILVPQALYLLVTAANLDDVFSCTPNISITVLFSFKLMIIMMNSVKLKACLRTIENDWSSLNTDTEKTILQRYTAYGQYMGLLYAVVFQLTAIVIIFKSTVMVLLEDLSEATTSSLSEESKLPYRVEYGDKLGQYVYPTAIHCYLAVYAHMNITIAVDTLYITLVQHACGMFAIVGHTLEHIGKDDDANFDLKADKVTDGNYSKALACLRRHVRIIGFADLIESAFTNIFLLSVCLNMVCGSMIGIQVIMNLNDTKNIIEPIVIYLAQIIHLFLQFWQGQSLLTYSAVPYQSICKANWYYTSERCRKILLLIMSRTLFPCKITAGKIVTLSIENFGVVLKTSMSYFMMMRSFQ